MQYILGGDSISERLAALDYLGPDSVLIKEKLLVFSTHEHTAINSQINVHHEAFNKIIFGGIITEMSNDFPAEQIHTLRSWSDLILPQATLDELQSIEDGTQQPYSYGRLGHAEKT
ncbi:hypothetical protein EJ377_17390 [Chryseobacterium arthrosphaerae]|uniref:Uncharacterized protein n=1 Tax=Chryseobacterium arthrosphaerae TaxID=651561 RepID=A0A432DSU4_9FLAO|nr:hypothetical protein EJ377_17390 [Chryseobacterium arthrosphaerae]